MKRKLCWKKIFFPYIFFRRLSSLLPLIVVDVWRRWRCEKSLLIGIFSDNSEWVTFNAFLLSATTVVVLYFSFSSSSSSSSSFFCVSVYIDVLNNIQNRKWRFFLLAFGMRKKNSFSSFLNERNKKAKRQKLFLALFLWNKCDSLTLFFRWKFSRFDFGSFIECEIALIEIFSERKKSRLIFCGRHF